MRPIQRFARFLLGLYPPTCRREYGWEILRSLEDELRDARSWPRAARAWIAGRAIADIVAGALLEWIALLRRRSRSIAATRAGVLRPTPVAEGGRRRPPTLEQFRGLLSDVRYASRTLRKSPGFTAVSVLTVAIATGATTTIFTIVNGVLLKPLPYAASDRLVNIWNDLGRGAQSLPAVHPADFRDYQAWSGHFQEFAAASGGNVVQSAGILTDGGSRAEQVDVSAVTANFFPLLGVTPVFGRQFTADEERPNGPRVAIVAHSLWQRRFGGDPHLVGRTIELDGRNHTVVGVLPRAFHLYLPAEAFLVKDAAIWLPLSIDYGRLPPRNYTYFTVFGRLKADVTVQQAQAEMDAIAERLRHDHAVHRGSDLRIRVVPLHHDVVKRVRRALLILQAAVGVVLLISCVNVAHLLLARARTRVREFAVHAALGANRARIARRLLMESFLVTALGTAAGIALAQAALWSVARLQSVDLPRMDAIDIDRTVFVTASLMCLGTALLSGVLPACHASTRDTVTHLKEGAWGSDGTRQDRIRRRLIVGEVALSLVLLVGAALLVRSAVALHHVNPGFDPHGVLTFRIALPAESYPRGVERRAFLEGLEGRLRRLPGVEVIGAVSQLPLTGSGPLSPYAFDEETARNWESVTADGRRASPDFFRAIGARLLAGRFFTEQDGAHDRQVIIIDDLLAGRVWPNQRAVGQRLQVAPPGNDDTHAEVVGVIGHPRLHDLAHSLRPQIWEPLLPDVGQDLSFAVRTRGDPALLGHDVRKVIADIDGSLAVSALQPLASLVAKAGAQSRLNAVLMLAFAGLALTLASVGVYGVVAYSVAQRTREFAIRQALGQDPAALRRMVLGQAARLGTTAIVLGLIGARLAARLLEGLLFDTDSGDPLTFAGAAALLLAIVIAAAWVPARHATRIDPLVALKSDAL